MDKTSQWYTLAWNNRYTLCRNVRPIKVQKVVYFAPEFRENWNPEVVYFQSELLVHFDSEPWYTLFWNSGILYIGILRLLFSTKNRFLIILYHMVKICPVIPDLWLINLTTSNVNPLFFY